VTKVAVEVSYWTIEYLSLRPQANEVAHPEHKPFTVQAINLTRPRSSTGPKRKTRPRHAAKIIIGYLAMKKARTHVRES
jgi:hypothetical protein